MDLSKILSVAEETRFICLFDVIRPEYANQQNRVCSKVLAALIMQKVYAGLTWSLAHCTLFIKPRAVSKYPYPTPDYAPPAVDASSALHPQTNLYPAQLAPVFPGRHGRGLDIGLPDYEVAAI